MWFQYKKDKKQSYKNIDSQKAFIKKLLKLSNNNPFTAGEIIEQSMASNWDGIFELKIDHKREESGQRYERLN